jgi:hypothetical protein
MPEGGNEYSEVSFIDKAQEKALQAVIKIERQLV